MLEKKIVKVIFYSLAVVLLLVEMVGLARLPRSYKVKIRAQIRPLAKTMPLQPACKPMWFSGATRSASLPKNFWAIF